MADWVKLDPVHLGEWLSVFSSSRERGEWAFGFQAGALGAMLRPGAPKPEIDGHTKGTQLRKEKEEDKNSVSEKQRAHVQARWNKRPPKDPGSIPRYESGTDENDTEAVPREEKRGEENFPKGGNGYPSPSNEIPVWKVIQSERENKAESARRKIADLRPSVERWEAMGDRLKPDARERLEKARSDIRALETEIYGYGLKP